MDLLEFLWLFAFDRYGCIDTVFLETQIGAQRTELVQKLVHWRIGCNGGVPARVLERSVPAVDDLIGSRIIGETRAIRAHGNEAEKPHGNCGFHFLRHILPQQAAAIKCVPNWTVP